MRAWLQPVPAFFALFGLLFGSFLNVVRIRMPEGMSIVHPGSRCPRCQHPLAAWQNIPVLSWMLLCGRCSFCHFPISPTYPIVEIATSVLWTMSVVASVRQPAPIVQAVASAIFCWIMLLLAALDWQHFWLPDRITWPTIMLGLLWRGLHASIAPLPISPMLAAVLPAMELEAKPGVIFAAVLAAVLAALAGAAIVLVLRFTYWLVRRREGMGLGDAKLLAAIGAWLGFTAMLDSFLVAVLGASVAALLWIPFHLKRRSNQGWSTMSFPLGVVLAFAAIAEIFSPAWLLHLWLQLAFR